MKNFKLFELVRKNQRVSGGGLMIGVDNDLKALQVRQGDDEVECVSVVVSVSGTEIRAVCGYGPQNRDSVGRKTLFWDYLDKEVEYAVTNNQILIIQMDSNCHAGSGLIHGDPNPQNENGKYLQCFMDRNPRLTIVNSLDLCQGLVTRHRVTTQREEKSILYLFIVCEKALTFIDSMNVDEKGQFKLTNFKTLQGGKKTTYSDHNILTLNCNFEVGQTKPQRVQLFDFFNQEGLHLFTEETINTNKFLQCFEDNNPFTKQAQKWFKVLNNTFHQCFTKIWSRKRKLCMTDVDMLFDRS